MLRDSARPVYVFDPNEERYWGPFTGTTEAEDFIASDKYLESWCLTKEEPIPGLPVYPPHAYFGSWPVGLGA